MTNTEILTYNLFYTAIIGHSLIEDISYCETCMEILDKFNTCILK